MGYLMLTVTRKSFRSLQSIDNISKLYEGLLSVRDEEGSTRISRRGYALTRSINLGLIRRQALQSNEGNNSALSAPLFAFRHTFDHGDCTPRGGGQRGRGTAT